MLSAKPTICTERAKIYTDVYRENESQPVIIKRAIALSETLKSMTIFINPGELIVGNQASRNRAAPVYPEYAVEWILEEIDSFDKRPGDVFYPDNETKEELHSLCSWWKGKTTFARGQAIMPDELREIHESGIIRAEGNLTSGDGHIAINNDKLLKTGISGYMEEIGRYRKQINIAVYEDLKKEIFYKSVLLGLNAISGFILRYADLAEKMAQTESSPLRKEELLKIAGCCRHISLFPPDTFYQALQLTFFIQLILQIESNGHSLSLGRMDQYLLPHYLKDREKGILSDEFVMELLENTWIKLFSILKIRPWSHTRYSAGNPLYQNVTIGGQTVKGKDAVNDLSYLILKSVGLTRLTQPNLSVRFHKNISNDFLMECINVIQKGFGMPAFNNDDIVIPSLIKLGVQKEDAYNYSAIGCIEVAVPGKWGYRCTGKHFLNFMRVLMAALNDGKDTVTGKTFHKGTGSLEYFTGYKQVLDAWENQIKYFTRAGVAIDAVIDIVLKEETPDILCSAFTDDCMERGKTIHEGGSKYDFVSGLQVGIANLGNSLAAIKKLVFEDKKITGKQLKDALDSNFKGKNGERIKQLILNSVPKYGNDDDYVDELLKEAYSIYIEEIEKYYTIRKNKGPIGCRYYAGTSSISANVPSGAVVPATPDGRKAWTPLAEGCSPSSGTDIKGPTAVFKSVSKLPTGRILGGVLLNQKLSPSVLTGITEKEKLISLWRVFFSQMKGWHVQYNIVDRNTLIEARKYPEKYRDLIVRVAGYSAFFTTLSRDTQDDIIARTEHTL